MVRPGQIEGRARIAYEPNSRRLKGNIELVFQMDEGEIGGRLGREAEKERKRERERPKVWETKRERKRERE